MATIYPEWCRHDSDLCPAPPGILVDVKSKAGSTTFRADPSRIFWENVVRWRISPAVSDGLTAQIVACREYLEAHGYKVIAPRK